MTRETKQQRAKRQAFERKVFVSVLLAAGNMVVEEFMFDAREADKRARPKLPRSWRFDVAIPACEIHLGTSGNVSMSATQAIGIEIEGYGHGHQGTKYVREDLEKYLEAFAQGWNVLRVSWAMIADGTALDALARAGVRVASVRGKTYPVEGE